MIRKNKAPKRPLLIALDILIIVLAVSGLYLILKPMIIHWQQDNLTSQLRNAYEQGDGTIMIDPNALEVPGEEVDYVEAVETFTTTSESVSESSATASETQATGMPETTPTPSAEPTAEPTTAPTPAAQVTVTAIGRIKIPVINLSMPIAEGSTKYNLRVAIGHYSNSAGLGQPGTCVLFGHRMYTYGRHFNRLGEVKIGHQIIIEDKVNRFTYEVDKIDVILPDQLIFELNTRTEGSRIMLVTCTPVKVASHRLLVKGNLIKTEPLG